MINITKTSAQARLEKESNKNSDNICPECKFPNLGIVLTMERFFYFEKMNKYTCFECGCEWNTGWKKV